MGRNAEAAPDSSWRGLSAEDRKIEHRPPRRHAAKGPFNLADKFRNSKQRPECSTPPFGRSPEHVSRRSAHLPEQISGFLEIHELGKSMPSDMRISSLLS